MTLALRRTVFLDGERRLAAGKHAEAVVLGCSQSGSVKGDDCFWQ
jgi:hypothetical protein